LAEHSTAASHALQGEGHSDHSDIVAEQVERRQRDHEQRRPMRSENQPQVALDKNASRLAMAIGVAIIAVLSADRFGGARRTEN
jgi:hypothetical protein